ncbi:MAG TPA: elongation factor P [Ktedonobacterales bacterium]|jgi:elongation factor P
MRATPSELRNDMLIRYRGEWQRILEFHHVSQGQMQALIRAKLKQLSTGEEHEVRLRAGEVVELLPAEHRHCDFLYRDEDHFIFLNPATYDEVPFPAEHFGGASRFLKSGVVAEGILAGDQLVNVELPHSLDVTVKDTSDTISGEYSAKGWKTAIVETGARIEVPLFVQPEDVVKVNTRTGEYMERVHPS